ncbi:HD domain-containing protein [Franzmannia pantelleriensis]|uniref:HD domain-containing protein n=1 Tax=Franzmannia pantelleriensis TaxID=48727 RepID=A0A1G9GY94_9GAMM|nr:HD domain-containing phosphohydrolase [Halomonas pantelleriensis]SDL05641.1 HD domain-containing protein [Halomonas pantelleriensis]
MEPSDSHLVVEHSDEINALLEGLSEPGGASLAFGEPAGEPIPALLMAVEEGHSLLIDITAVSEIASDIDAHKPLRLMGQANGAMLTTPPLVFQGWVQAPGRLQFRCDYPQQLWVMHRREVFRAELRPGMHVAASLVVDDGQETLQLAGQLRNLSLGGCLLEVPLSTAMRLRPGQHVEALTLRFPNQQQLSARAHVRHIQTDGEQQVRLGCEFSEVNAELERRLWYFVREVEREGARNTLEGNRDLSPSALFDQEGSAPAAPARSHGADYATPMARRLAKVAAYLDGQLLQLMEGQPVDAGLLSRYSDTLLGLHEEDREALLFASVCLVDDPVLIQHGIGVAIKLADLASAQGLPRDVRKALVASAMLHDLGKALLPPALRQALRRATSLSEAQRDEMREHVSLLAARLDGCRWLSQDICHAVVWGINERLDGSGYPAGRPGEQLESLARMAAVVDVAEAMSRPRADRPARSPSEIYRHLLGQPQAFDREWVQRYIRRFGITPVGSLARFPSGELGWVQRLDRQGALRQVQLTPRPVQPGSELGEVLRDAQLARLGKPEALVVPRPISQVTPG